MGSCPLGDKCPHAPDLLRMADEHGRMKRAIELTKSMIPHLSSPQRRALAWGTKMLPTEQAIYEIITAALTPLTTKEADDGRKG